MVVAPAFEQDRLASQQTQLSQAKHPFQAAQMLELCPSVELKKEEEFNIHDHSSCSESGGEPNYLQQQTCHTTMDNNITSHDQSEIWMDPLLKPIQEAFQH